MSESSNRVGASGIREVELDTNRVQLDLSNWIEANFDRLKDRRLTEITLPGSHNAGMYKSRDCSTLGIFACECNTKCQARTIAQQLSDGIRYFDLRPVWDSAHDYFDIGHFNEIPLSGYWGCLGGSITEVLGDISAFASAHPKELVILHFSHYLDRKADKEGFAGWVNRVATLMADNLAPVLVKNLTAVNLLSLTLEELLQKGSVIALFDNIETDWPRGILNSDALHLEDNPYSDTNDFDKMRREQFERLESWYEKQDHNTVFRMWWTLTQSKTQASTCGSRIPFIDSIEHLAKKANENLVRVPTSGRYSGCFPNILVADYCDSLLTEVCQQINAWGAYDVDFSSPDPVSTDEAIFCLDKADGAWGYDKEFLCRGICEYAKYTFRLMVPPICGLGGVKLIFNLQGSPAEGMECDIDILLKGQDDYPIAAGFKPERTGFYDVMWPIDAGKFKWPSNEIVLIVEKGVLLLRKIRVEYDRPR